VQVGSERERGKEEAKPREKIPKNRNKAAGSIRCDWIGWMESCENAQTEITRGIVTPALNNNFATSERAA